MLIHKDRGGIAAMCGVVVLGALSTGCSSYSDQAAFTCIRGFALAARPADFTGAISHVEPQRHVREHALSGIRNLETLHHQPGRTLKLKFKEAVHST